MTLEEQGVYINLLCHYWNGGCSGLVSQTDSLAMLSGLQIPDKQSSLDKVITLGFVPEGGLLHNQKMRTIYRSMLKLSNARAKAGRAGNAKRWHGDPLGTPKPITNDPSSVFSLQSSSSKEEKKEEKRGDPHLWGLIKAYGFCQSPGPEGKRKAFQDLIRQGVTYEAIRDAGKDQEHTTWDFFEIMRSLKPKPVQKTRDEKVLEILAKREGGHA